jgi:hypothetical protein
MTLNVEQLVAALPEEIDRELARPPTQALSELLSAMSAQAVPVGAIHRLWSMGTLQAKVALAYLSYWLRSSFAAAGERERLLNETHWRAALKTVAGMSYLRGIAMKAGQTLANYPNLMPEQFVEALSRLNFEAPPMHYSAAARARAQRAGRRTGEPVRRVRGARRGGGVARAGAPRAAALGRARGGEDSISRDRSHDRFGCLHIDRAALAHAAHARVG